MSDPIARYEPNIEVFNPDPGFRSTEGTEFEGYGLGVLLRLSAQENVQHS